MASTSTLTPKNGTGKRPRKAKDTLDGFLTARKLPKVAPDLAAGTAPLAASDDPESDDLPLGPSPQRKQLEVPGTAPPRNRKVENAALAMRTTYLAWKAAQETFLGKQGHCQMVMEQEGVTSIRVTDGEGDEIVFVLDTPDAKVKMKKVNAPGDGPD